MKVLFVAGFGPIVRDMEASKALYVEALALPLTGEYPMTEELEGVKHLGLWSLQAAAQSCFGQDDWPADVPVPQATLELEVADVAGAAREMSERGYALVHGPKTEPWNQTIARLLSPDGLLIGLCHTPSLHGHGS